MPTSRAATDVIAIAFCAPSQADTDVKLKYPPNLARDLNHQDSDESGMDAASAFSFRSKPLQFPGGVCVSGIWICWRNSTKAEIVSCVCSNVSRQDQHVSRETRT